MVNCITVLTRGYDDINKYHKLIKRNIHISNNLNDKSMDILIFHEGNITNEQQVYIKSMTPDLNISFIDIHMSNIGFQDNKKSIEVEDVHGEDFGIGYRHMCSFWFINFFNAVKNYDKMVRIDEDCFINSNIDKIFLQLEQYTFVCGERSVDAESVTIGLNKFSLDFVNKYKEEFTFKTQNPKRPYGPYTNLFGVSLNKIHTNEAFQKYKNEVDGSEMIYKRRWGDLPLWGEAIYYIFGDDSLCTDNSIRYFHESHMRYVN